MVGDGGAVLHPVGGVQEKLGLGDDGALGMEEQRPQRLTQGGPPRLAGEDDLPAAAAEAASPRTTRRLITVSWRSPRALVIRVVASTPQVAAASYAGATASQA